MNTDGAIQQLEKLIGAPLSGEALLLVEQIAMQGLTLGATLGSNAAVAGALLTKEAEEAAAKLTRELMTSC